MKEVGGVQEPQDLSLHIGGCGIWWLLEPLEVQGRWREAASPYSKDIPEFSAPETVDMEILSIGHFYTHLFLIGVIDYNVLKN